MGMIPKLAAAKKFAKNGIDTPLPAPTPVFTTGSGAATVIYQLETDVDYAFPTIQLKVSHAALTAPNTAKIAGLIRQVSIKGPDFKEPLVIEGPALEDIPIAACALLTRLGMEPNFNSLYVDNGFGVGATADVPVSESEAYLAIPAVLRPGKYQFEIQYSGATPVAGITNRSLRIVGTQRELPNEGLYFCPAAKRVINTVANGQGLGDWDGRYVLVGNPAVGCGIKGGVDSNSVTHINVGIRFSDGYMPTNDVIIEGVKYYERALGQAITKQVYQNPNEFNEITLSRPTTFDITIVHFKCAN